MKNYSVITNLAWAGNYPGPESALLVARALYRTGMYEWVHVTNMQTGEKVVQLERRGTVPNETD